MTKFVFIIISLFIIVLFPLTLIAQEEDIENLQVLLLVVIQLLL